MWYRLSEELLKLSDDTLHQVFKPYIERLITCLCVHCQLDEDTSPVSTDSDLHVVSSISGVLSDFPLGT